MKKLPGRKKCCFLVHMSAGMGLLGNKRSVLPLGVLLGVICGHSQMRCEFPCYSTAFFPFSKLGMQLILGLIPVKT